MLKEPRGSEAPGIAAVHFCGKSAVKEVVGRLEQSGTDVRPEYVVHDVAERGVPGREVHLQQFDEETFRVGSSFPAVYRSYSDSDVSGGTMVADHSRNRIIY